MSARDNVQPKQLAMFMHPDDFHAQVEPNDFSPNEGAVSPAHKVAGQAGWDQKLAEAKESHGYESTRPDGSLVPNPSTYESIERNGIEQPVALWHAPNGVWHHHPQSGGPGYHDTTIVGNGHHRVAVATDLTRKGKTTYIPVEYQGKT